MIASRGWLLSVLASLLVGPQALVQDAPTPPPIVRVTDGGATVELNLDGVPLLDFIGAVQPLLQSPLHYEPADLASLRIRQPGVQRVPIARLRDAFDGVLRRFAVWTWDDVSGGSVVITLWKPSFSRGPSPLPFTPRMIEMEELESTPMPRLPLYTVTFQLRNANARDQLNTIQPVLNTTLETLRPTEPANVLVVTASLEHLRAVRDLLHAIDVPSPERVESDDRAAELEKQVVDLAARVAKLEAAAR